MFNCLPVYIRMAHLPKMGVNMGGSAQLCYANWHILSTTPQNDRLTTPVYHQNLSTLTVYVNLNSMQQNLITLPKKR